MVNLLEQERFADEILGRGTIVEVLPSKEAFRERLLGEKKMRFYIGFDATAPTLHLSHAKNIMLLEKFRQLGHEVILLFGDFTARIGDPTGESKARKQLTKEDVDKNVSEWQKQVRPLMRFDDPVNPPKVMFNSDWLSKLTFEEVLYLASNVTVQQMLERDMFEKRYYGEVECRKCGKRWVPRSTVVTTPSIDSFEEGTMMTRINDPYFCRECKERLDYKYVDISKSPKPIHLHEFLYPLMQGYDSVAMDVDVELCGTDQIFNALMGRTLLEKLKNKEKFVVAVTLMENPKTGELMSKSKGTGVFLNTTPRDMFGQIMAQPDEMMELLFVNCTHVSLDEIQALLASDRPRDTKVRLAREIVTIFHGEEVANKEERYFTETFSKKNIQTEDIPEREVKKETNILDALVSFEFAQSKGDARRKIEQGGVSIDGEKITDANFVFDESVRGKILRVGKKQFAKINFL